jgi:hypothetical protein
MNPNPRLIPILNESGENIIRKYRNVSHLHFENSFALLKKKLLSDEVEAIVLSNDHSVAQLEDIEIHSKFVSPNNIKILPKKPRYFKNFLKLLDPIKLEVDATISMVIKIKYKTGQEKLAFFVTYLYDDCTKLITYDYAPSPNFLTDGKMVAKSWSFRHFRSVFFLIPLSVLPKKSDDQKKDFIYFNALNVTQRQKERRTRNHITDTLSSDARYLEEVV